MAYKFENRTSFWDGIVWIFVSMIIPNVLFMNSVLSYDGHVHIAGIALIIGLNTFIFLYYVNKRKEMLLEVQINEGQLFLIISKFGKTEQIRIDGKIEICPRFKKVSKYSRNTVNENHPCDLIFFQKKTFNLTQKEIGELFIFLTEHHMLNGTNNSKKTILSNLHSELADLRLEIDRVSKS